MAPQDGKFDSELEAQLETAPRVQAVFRLRSPDPTRSAPTPEQTERTAREILERVERALGLAPHAVNVFRNLGYFVVDADPDFVRQLAEQDEVLSVRATRRTRA